MIDNQSTNDFGSIQMGKRMAYPAKERTGARQFKATGTIGHDRLELFQ